MHLFSSSVAVALLVNGACPPCWCLLGRRGLLWGKGDPGKAPPLFGFFPFAVTEPQECLQESGGGRPSQVNKPLLPDLELPTPIRVPIHRSETKEGFHPHSPGQRQPEH